MNINISINNKVATVNGSPVIVCGNSDYTVTFTFDSEWANLPTKQARFSWYLKGEKQFTDVTFTGHTVAVPTLADITALYVGVFAGDLHTTTPAKIICHHSALCGAGTKMLKGDTGDAATVEIGTVTTGAPGSKAQVTNVGTRGAAVLNIVLPQGETGPQGPAGAAGAAGETGPQGPAGSQGRPCLMITTGVSVQDIPSAGTSLSISLSSFNYTPQVSDCGFCICRNPGTAVSYAVTFQVTSVGATEAQIKVSYCAGLVDQVVKEGGGKIIFLGYMGGINASESKTLDSDTMRDIHNCFYLGEFNTGYSYVFEPPIVVWRYDEGIVFSAPLVANYDKYCAVAEYKDQNGTQVRSCLVIDEATSEVNVWNDVASNTINIAAASGATSGTVTEADIMKLYAVMVAASTSGDFSLLADLKAFVLYGQMEGMECYQFATLDLSSGALVFTYVAATGVKTLAIVLEGGTWTITTKTF